MKLVALSVIAALAVASSVYLMGKNAKVGDVPSPVYDAFVAFKQQYGKAYGTDSEESHRLGVFADNYKMITEHNAKNLSWTLAINEFADLSSEEFLAQRTGLRGVPSTQSQQAEFISGDIPTSFDWREVKAGVVGPVKNQGQCGSCWAFSTVSNIEGVRAVAGKDSVSLSEQQLVDCEHEDDQGCNGGLPENAMKYLIKYKKGLESEQDYPYSGRNGQCAEVASKEVGTIDSFVSVSQDENQMAAALMKYGPLSIGINAGPMQFYGGGIANPWSFLCSPSQLDHGVSIVGFGEGPAGLFKKTTKYWIIRNSWGSSWGEKGYYRIIRGVGKCGLNTMVRTAVVNA